MFHLFVAVCVLSLGSTGVQAALIEIGFDALQPGSTMPPNQYSPLGVTINLIGLPGVGPQVWGQGIDAYGLFGNTLWPSPAPYRVAIDDGPFFDMEFVFGQAIDFFSIIADNAEEPYQITAYLGAAPVSVTSAQTYLGNNSGAVFLNVLGQPGGSDVFDRVVVDLSQGFGDGPESWDSLRFNTTSTVPVPPAVWLFGSALGALGVVRRRVMPPVPHIDV